MVRENAGHHGFADRYGANANTGVVAAFRDDRCVAAALVHRFARRQDGAGWFDGEADDDVLAGRYAAEDAASIV